jgi:hypothetical protein
MIDGGFLVLTSQYQASASAVTVKKYLWKTDQRTVQP